MNGEKLKPNVLKILIYLLNQLEKRIYLLRISLYGDTENYFPDNVLVSNEILAMEDEDFETEFNLPPDDYRLMVDSCEIETCIHRILLEMENIQSYASLEEAVKQLENDSTAFMKHQKMIKGRKKEIEQLKELLPVLQEQAQVSASHQKSRKLEEKEKIAAKGENFDEIEFLKKLMNHKAESRKNYFEYKQAKLKKNIQWYERESRTQAHANAQIISFWILKYDNYSENLDLMLKKMFDNWEVKRRDRGVLRKYRRLNLEKTERLQKTISELEEYIEDYRKEKERELKKRKEELRLEYAATTIQAYWRGTMVRKHLGPYKIQKKKKKGKGKKKKR